MVWGNSSNLKLGASLLLTVSTFLPPNPGLVELGYWLLIRKEFTNSRLRFGPISESILQMQPSGSPLLVYAPAQTGLNIKGEFYNSDMRLFRFIDYIPLSVKELYRNRSIFSPMVSLKIATACRLNYI